MAEKDKNKNEKYYKVALTKLISVANQYINNEITDDDLSNFIDQLYIRLYIPLQEKMTIAMLVLTQHLYSTTDIQEIRVTELYKHLFFQVLLGAYGGIDCSNTDLTNYENYDLLYPIFAPFILSLCQDDYNIIKEMIRDSINLYSIQGFSDALSTVDMDSIKDETQQIKNMMSSLENNKDLIADLKDIAALNDPNTHEILQALKMQAKME